MQGQPVAAAAGWVAANWVPAGGEKDAVGGAGGRRAAAGEELLPGAAWGGPPKAVMTGYRAVQQRGSKRLDKQGGTDSRQGTRGQHWQASAHRRLNAPAGCKLTGLAWHELSSM